MSLIPGIPCSCCALVDVLAAALTPYMNSQQMWQAFTQHGLRYLLHHICFMAWSGDLRLESRVQESCAKIMSLDMDAKAYFDVLITAGKPAFSLAPPLPSNPLPPLFCSLLTVCLPSS